MTPRRWASAASKGASREHQVPGHGDADVGREGGGIGGVGDAAEQLGHPEGGAIAGHADVGHHGDQQATGLADPVDRGDDRGAAVSDRQEGQQVATEALGQRVALLGAPAEIATWGEDVAGAGDDQRTQVGVGVDQRHRSADAEVHRRREGVPRRWPIDHCTRRSAPHARASGSRCRGRQSCGGPYRRRRGLATAIAGDPAGLSP